MRTKNIALNDTVSVRVKFKKTYGKNEIKIHEYKKTDNESFSGFELLKFKTLFVKFCIKEYKTEKLDIIDCY